MSRYGVQTGRGLPEERPAAGTDANPMRPCDLPGDFNIASYFLDRNADDRTALITPTGRATYGELKS
ncbi:hypothetical protein ACFHYQ_27190, partial [Sphaerimonospora cavernae]